MTDLRLTPLLKTEAELLADRLVKPSRAEELRTIADAIERVADELSGLRDRLRKAAEQGRSA